jgi:hypothetical protein
MITNVLVRVSSTSSRSHFKFRVCVVEGILDDANISSIRFLGYSKQMELNAAFKVRRVVFASPPEYLYVTELDGRFIHSFWFANNGGTGEFDVVDGELTHFDAFRCSVSFSGGDLIFTPDGLGHCPRLDWGDPTHDGPRNSEEFLVYTIMNGRGPE